MDRRQAPRYKRRVPLRFWVQGSDQARKGFTINVSDLGLFIATSNPSPVGSLIRIELKAEGRVTQLEGEVRTSIRVDPVLRRLRQSGMGVRLLTTEEKMRQVIKLRLVEDEGPEESPAGQLGDQQETGTYDESAGLFSVYFETPEELAAAFESHLQHGGVFVPTQADAKRDDQVHLQFLLAWQPETIFQTSGTVVQTFSGTGGIDSTNAAAGIGVAFSEPQEVISHFRHLIDLPDYPEAAARSF